jgi:hypothetical protein
VTDQDLPPYDPERLLNAPFPERVRLVCRTFAAQSPNQPKVMALYWAKYFLLYIAGWAFFVSLSDGYPGFTSPVEWAFTGVAFKKAIAWSIFYELAGFGCGWGPMNARYKPMFGGCRHFLRPGTIKLPFVPGIPVFGGNQRTWLDVGLYSANQLLLLRALIAPEVTPGMLMPSLVLIPLMGLSDKTLFLAARAEHYWVALVCITVASTGDLWISACQALWAGIWFWAATSKLNHHFPGVIMVMMNNGPFFPKVLKRHLYRSYPDDLRPSRFATIMANFGTCAEYSIPLILLTSPNETVTILGLILMTGFHGFIALNNPNGMPIEWNILMIFGGIFLFGFHPEATPLALESMPLLALFLFFTIVVVPTYGNLFKKGASEKLDRLTKAGGTVRQQLAELLPDEQSLEVAQTMMLASRFMHLQGRPLLDALPRAVDYIDDYEWNEGEVLGGTIVGWNFGDGHLNGVDMLRAIQPICGFEEGEVRLISVESQPLFGRGWHWKIHDPVRGLIDEGDTAIAETRSLMPWPLGEHAEALMSRRSTDALADAVAAG